MSGSHRSPSCRDGAPTVYIIYEAVNSSWETPRFHLQGALFQLLLVVGPVFGDGPPPRISLKSHIRDDLYGWALCGCQVSFLYISLLHHASIHGSAQGSLTSSCLTSRAVYKGAVSSTRITSLACYFDSCTFPSLLSYMDLKIEAKH